MVEADEEASQSKPVNYRGNDAQDLVEPDFGQSTKARLLERGHWLYAAFLSYSHADEAAARWLHRKLESYRIPRSLAGRSGRIGAIPKRVGKVFRDREELAAGGKLKDNIEAALEDAETLVVLCSPHSATSQYVNAEVDYFRHLGREDRVIPVILSGEPPSCFPPSLLNGRERLAADWREGRDERADVLIKVVAGILGVSKDELAQRERIARRWRARAIVALAGVFLMLALLASWLGWQAEQGRRQAFSTLTRIFAERAWDAIDREEYYLAARYALAGWRLAEATESQMRSALAHTLHHTGESSVLGEQGDVVWSGMYSEDGTQILTACRDGIARLWDASNGRLLMELNSDKYFMSKAVIDPTGRRIVTVSGDVKAGYRVLLWSTSTKDIVAELSGSDITMTWSSYLVQPS